MIIYRLAYGPQRGRWVLEVDGVVYDKASALATLRELYPSARVSLAHQPEEASA